MEVRGAETGRGAEPRRGAETGSREPEVGRQAGPGSASSRAPYSACCCFPPPPPPPPPATPQQPGAGATAAHLAAANHDGPRRLAIQQQREIHFAPQLHLVGDVQRVDRLALGARLRGRRGRAGVRWRRCGWGGVIAHVMPRQAGGGVQRSAACAENMRRGVRGWRHLAAGTAGPGCRGRACLVTSVPPSILAAREGASDALQMCTPPCARGAAAAAVESSSSESSRGSS